VKDEADSKSRQDRKLAKALRNGSDRAWQEFYARYATPVYRFVLARARSDAEAAKDITRETLVIAVERIADFDWRKGELWPWICGIAMNKMRETAREKARDGRLAEVFDERNATRTGDGASADALDVEYVLSTLRPDWQDVLEQKYILGKSVREMAETLQMSEKAVESRLTRARDAFRQAYDARPHAAEGSTS
jgi:RNA polymerase sigma-70 factor (ECF subfamily)